MRAKKSTAWASPVSVERLRFKLVSDERRVIALPFMFGAEGRLQRLAEGIEGLSEAEVQTAVRGILDRFGGRHVDLCRVFEENYAAAADLGHCRKDLSRDRQLLMGGYVTMEFSIESTALFNPSITPHPDQAGVPAGALRFIMSLRATGEGHVSSIVFRTGQIDAHHRVHLDPPARFSAQTRLAPSQYYVKPLFRRKLGEMGVNLKAVDAVIGSLPDTFTMVQLDEAIGRARRPGRSPIGQTKAVESMRWLANANYQLELEEGKEVSAAVIFPRSPSEARGVEDLRLVRFVDDDGAVTYYGTYTGHDGYHMLPLMIETKDFRRFEVHTLNGSCAQNKGLALFPRRIGGHYVMCSRIDGQNLFVMYSDMVHFWESAEQLASPRYAWELNLIGNCGSPIETPEGWLLLTHGVGPMRRYCIGAMLLDLEDPLRVIGRLREPLIAPTEKEREGYVPNVVYSCGALVHQGRLYLPYAKADRATLMASVALDELLGRLLDRGA